jgi:hypothetical protein
MWEVRAYPRTFTDLLNWVCEVAVPGVEVEPLHVSSEIFSSADLRVVVISRWHGEPRALPVPPAGLTASSPHVWDFTPVDR